MTTTSTNRARAALGGLALLSAPGLLLVGGAIHPQESSDAARQLEIVAGSSNRWYLAHALFVVGFALLVPAVLALGRRLRAAAGGLELVGTGLAVMGAIAMVGFMALEGFGTWQLAQVGGPGAAEVLHRLVHGTGAVAPFAVAGLGIQAGLVVLAVGLGRTGAAPAWISWALAASAIALAIGFVAQVDAVLILGNVGLVVAMAAVGLADLKGRPSGSAEDSLSAPRPTPVGAGR